ncbi:MAG: hypothetical protein II399_05805, partial [Lachnospiraceae bacterium]|nr:hypothetical protein [Lachnospiraceae bacterium]
MKKILVAILALSLMVCFLTACGNKENNETPSAETPSADTTSVDSFKTIGDIISDETAQYNQAASLDGKFIYVFEMDGSYYRAYTAIDDKTSDALFALDVTAEDYQEQYNKLASPLVIEKIENLDEQIIPQEELDKLAGKSVEELINEGWSNTGYSLEGMEFWMTKGAFEYTFILDGEVKNEDEFDFDNDAQSFTVKSASL